MIDAETKTAMVVAALDQWLGPNGWGRTIPFGEIRRNQMLAALTAAMLAAEARGFKLVGPEANETMLDWGHAYAQLRECFRTMHAAAPRWEDK